MFNSLLQGTDMYLLLNHLKEGSPSTEEDDPSTAILSDYFFMVGTVVSCVPNAKALTETENRSVNAP